MSGGEARIAAADTRADLAAVVELMRNYAAALPIDLAFQDFAAEMAAMPGHYAPPRGALLLARSSVGQPVGCVALRPFGADRCEMKRLYVAPAGRGVGIGCRLVEAVIIEAERIGYGAMLLDTLPTMTNALALYRRLGFEDTKPYYATPIAGTVFLRRPLGRKASQ